MGYLLSGNGHLAGRNRSKVEGQTLKTLKSNISKTVRVREKVSIEDFDVRTSEKHFEIENVNRSQIGNYTMSFQTAELF